MVQNALSGKRLSAPVQVHDLLNGRSVTTMQVPFPLTEADFLRLKGGTPATAWLANIVFSGVVGYAVSLGPKITQLVSSQGQGLERGETVTLVIGVIASILLYVVGFWWPNEKRKTLKKISVHFDQAKPSLHVWREHQ